ncbi:hypothetical protein BWK62_13660 [Flavobacterium oreochromis]|uniref:Uncharacterized protein n=1 Tax=Flavobacterium columnare TaxID=996 RepID=A0A246G7W1_9FLAO|nr:hypothetical protein BWK62_13660 [Flavobacterium oreochromis]
MFLYAYLIFFVWKFFSQKKTTQSCVEKKIFKKNYTTLCGKNILKKNPHNFVWKKNFKKKSTQIIRSVNLFNYKDCVLYFLRGGL